MSERLVVRYRFPATVQRAAERAEAIALEQSVEMPRPVIPPQVAAARIPGEVTGLAQVGDGQFEATISLDTGTTGPTTSQLLNVLFGNTSLQSDVTLHDADIPMAVLASFPGPRFGIESAPFGEAKHGPLTATALKPVGLDSDQLASLCETFARAGIDWIKDDHGIGDQSYAPFRSRVAACQAAVDRASDATGRQSLYIANLTGGPTALFGQLAYAQQVGVRAVMVSPMLVGIPVFEELARRAEGTLVIAHPAWSGSLNLSPAFLFGRLYRLFGADAVVFVNHGGRFGYSPAECQALAANLRTPWAHLKAAWPVPAGGMTVDRIEEMAAFYGPDVVLLVSGALYGPGDTIAREARRLVEAVGAVRRQR